MNTKKSAPSRLRTATGQGANLAVIVLGFGFCRAWIVACLAIPTIHRAVYGTNWLYLTMGALAALFVAFATHATVGKSERFHEHVAESTFGLLLASSLAIPASLVLDSLLLAFVGFMTGGIAAGMLQVLLGERFSTHETTFVTIASALAAIVTALCLVCSEEVVRIIGYAAFPLCSFLLLTIECKRNRISWRTGRSLDEIDGPAYSERIAAEAEGFEGLPSIPNETGKLVAKLMASVAIFSFLVRMFDSVPASGIDPFGAIGGSSLFALVVVGFAFSATAMVMKERFDVTRVYRVAVPIMVLGCVVLAVFFEVNSAIAILLIGIGYEFFDVLVWILFASMSRTHRDGAGYIYGLGVASMFFGMAAGLLAGDLAHTLISSGALQLTMIAMASIISLVFTGFMLFPEGMMSKLSPLRPETKKQRKASPDSEARTTEEKASASEQRPLEERCSDVARDCGLTPREGEVLILLAKGRTVPVIARDLQIAKGTARTHTERIYRKLDVHKQQELIDKVENA